MKIKSSAFLLKQAIPKKFTGDGPDVSPPLEFDAVPTRAKSLVIIVDDPDAPKGTFNHWLTWNIAAHSKGLQEGHSGPVQGRNDFGEVSYCGPKPPPGKPHRYFFKLFALDCVLGLKEGASRSHLEEAMSGHILETSEWVGTYQR